MLELAHERQFAISQLGTCSAGFGDEHSTRVQGTIKQLHDHFTAHGISELHRPTSPHTESLIDFRAQCHPFSPLPPLDMISGQSRREPCTPSPTMELKKPSRSPLALQELMNPAPLTSSNLKRKLSNEFITSMLAEDGPEDVLDSEIDGLLDTLPIKYNRAKHVTQQSATSRTRRGVRMRKKSQSVLRHHSSHDSAYADQFEKDAELLLNLSQIGRRCEHH